MNKRIKIKKLKQELREIKRELDLYNPHTENLNISYSKHEIRKISVQHEFDSNALDEDYMIYILKHDLLTKIVPYIQIEKPDYHIPELGGVCCKASLTIVVPK